jgi:alcohol dehydrogenase
MSKEAKVAVFMGPKKGFEIQNIEIPELKGREILVKVEACTLCGSDIHTYKGRRGGDVPGALGHEICGRIEQFGAQASRNDYSRIQLKKGDRITWLLYSYKQSDPLSQKGFPQKSKNMFKYGHELITANNTFHTGFAEYIILRPGTTIHKVGNSISSELASTLNCGLATCFAAKRVSVLKPEDNRVAVMGSGLLGLYMMTILKQHGVEHVTAVDVDTERLENAKFYGVDETILFDDLQDFQFDLVFEMSGRQEAMQKALQMLGIGGRLILVGGTYTQPDIQLNGEELIRNLNTITGIHNYIPDDLQNAVDFLDSCYNLYPFEKLIEKKFPLKEVDLAFEYAEENRPVRVVVCPDE